MTDKTDDLTARNFRSAHDEALISSADERYAAPESAYRLAFTDTDFLLREELRPVRMQLELLKPSIAVLDEIGSGLDVDALKVVSDGINRVRASGKTGVMLITHYTRILRYVQPDQVHVFAEGRIVERGGPELADALEAEGYERYTGRDLASAGAN